MNHQLILKKNGKRIDLSPLISNLTWTSNIDTLGMELSFNFAINDTRYFEQYNDLLETGDQVVLLNGSKVLNYFIVVKEMSNGRYAKSYICFDRAWYLNKNETVIQFKKATATDAIQKLLDRFNIKHNIASMNTLITKIYKDITLIDIINDILYQVYFETKNVYRLEMDKDIVTIRKQSDLLINPMVRLSSNTNEFPTSETIAGLATEKSIENMKNKVIVVSDTENSTNIFAEKSDQINIDRYGLMTEVVTVNDKNAAQARNIANTVLYQLSKTGNIVTCEMLGHDDIRSGRLIDLNEPISGVVGRYLIRGVTHTINNGIHTSVLEMERG
ncbi:XkdQ/YqbQ family protein [Marinicrinis sediminis]|uniref:YqbQ/XkdQ domain-containing protein n=1 Tax=Marinicrinis sediminis TaxID=1652465 RepID=A0ABW5RAJ8_9BACL